MTVPTRVSCDTSFLSACLDPRDRNHARATGLVEESAAAGLTLWTTWDLVGETATWLRYRRHFQAARAFLVDVKATRQIVTSGNRVRENAEDVLARYGRDHRLSSCDAISFVDLTLLLHHAPCVLFDEDFRRLGLNVLG